METVMNEIATDEEKNIMKKNNVLDIKFKSNEDNFTYRNPTQKPVKFNIPR
jgi:hypothetical protein